MLWMHSAWRGREARERRNEFTEFAVAFLSTQKCDRRRRRSWKAITWMERCESERRVSRALNVEKKMWCHQQSLLIRTIWRWKFCVKGKLSLTRHLIIFSSLHFLTIRLFYSFWSESTLKAFCEGLNNERKSKMKEWKEIKCVAKCHVWRRKTRISKNAFDELLNVSEIIIMIIKWQFLFARCKHSWDGLVITMRTSSRSQSNDLMVLKWFWKGKFGAEWRVGYRGGNLCSVE